MGDLRGELEVEVELKSPTDKFYDVFRGKVHHLPNCTQRIHDVKLHEGEWHSHGAVKHWTYVLPDGKVESGKEKFYIDDENKTLKFEFFEGDPLKDLKVYNGILKVSPKGDKGGVAHWTLEYERRSPSIPPPHHYLDFVVHLTKELDAALTSA
ncbi:MLP-like protein 43 [Malania oleifera]|uniref:MLP-like protein 43 n=1 Tax=Malania oleifera TaxID=397392 RepID=UPI0025AE870D|nr:MLP-like protein 43 [Malania oleifera]